MAHKLAALMGIDDPLYELRILELERASGNHGVDVQLLADIAAQSHTKIKELGLDPADTAGPELYHGLLNMARLHESFLSKRIGVKDAGNVAQTMTAIQHTIERIKIPKSAWVLKQSVARKLLRAHPPKKVMKQLGYRSVDSLLKREPIAEIYVGSRFLESVTWQKNLIKKYSKLRPVDFETRDVAIVRLDGKKWGNTATEYVWQNRRPLTHLKELGVIALLPLPVEHMEGITLALMPLVLHYVNEIRMYSTYLKFHQSQADFGAFVAKVIADDPMSHLVLASQPIHWRIAHRHYGRVGNHPEVFEPYLSADDLSWRSAEDTLYKLEPALHFWHDMDYVALSTHDGPVSCNLIDVAVSYVNQLSYEHRASGHFRTSLEQELLTRYLGQPTLERQVLHHLDNKVSASVPAV